MHRFIARQNIARFEAQLKECSDETTRQTLRQLLAAEQKKLDGLDRATLSAAE
jgi:hypothetical protein